MVGEKKPLQITLRAARQNAGLTQEQAGKLLGVKPQRLSKWERNSANAPMWFVEKLEPVYGTPASNIFFGKENEFISLNKK